MPFAPDQGSALLSYLRERAGAMLSAIEDLVSQESPSGDVAALDALRAKIARRFFAVGASVARVPDGSLLVQFGVQAGRKRPSLILGHFDTVWPIGTLARLPFRVEDGRAYGPGVYDMKAGLVLAEFALKAINDLRLTTPRTVMLLLTPDEEVGSVQSRASIELAAREAAFVLVPEPPLEGGALKTARKGIGRFTVEVTGRAAHAGVEPEKGISAVVELAHQVLALQGLADPPAGTTLNVGLIRGGTAPNVVPAEASAAVDVRVATLAEATRIEAAMADLRPVLAGARVAVSGGFNRPPMERSPAIADLFGRAQVIGQSLGMELTEGSTGGGSDGNFTAALGIPTLDGLGVPGAGAHADHEHILVDSLPQRAALLAALLLGL
jgi:glutamate carboxypeptidase